jgi:hypothetical protein
MALFYAFARSTLVNSSSALSQSLALNKQDSKWVSDLIRDNTKRHWRKVAVVGACGALIAGAYKVHCSLKEWKEQQELAAEGGDDVHLLASLSNVQSVSSTVVDLTLQAMGTIQDCEPEIEDVLEVDPIHVGFMRTELELVSDKLENGKQDPNYVEKVDRAHRKRSRAERKKISATGYGVALKSLVNRAKLAFPVPKETEIQAQAINLFLYKECRKLNLRIADAAALIPKATALAMVPSDVQIECGQLMGIPMIQKRYLRRGWKSTPEPLTSRIISGVMGFVKSQ